jgi:hypothetical protein
MMRIKEDENGDFSGMGLITTQASAAANISASQVANSDFASHNQIKKPKNMTVFAGIEEIT